MRYGTVLTAVMMLALALAIGCNSMQTSSAILRYQQGEFEMADSLCREALKVNPNDGEAYFYLALSQSMMQRYDEAYVNFKKAAELKPKRSEMAQQNIDLLEILKEKTKGNLDQQESKLIENILYELRMAFLEVCRSQQKES